ncbi:gp5 [Corynebacterium phage P1201]|uniref:Gp5 n=1 Tax=Corynebacterium phage P1201 TaxID=384848 RepID=A7IY76_9CAUD|nr:gp5 [Corynebacterium phage P1201]ABF57458.1 gp5 [Corynebacterium phage P1201]
MDMSFIVDHHVSAGGILFQDEMPVEVKVFDALPGTEVTTGFDGEAGLHSFLWEPAVYLDGFRLTEWSTMDEAVARATTWREHYVRLNEIRQPSFERLGEMTTGSGPFKVQVSVWKVQISGLEGKIVKATTSHHEERIYAV